jgi:hypothetical protein
MLPNQPASAEQESKSTPPLDTPTPEAKSPASETAQVWDQERAMETIHKQREEEKKLKAQLKDYERLKAEEQKRVEAQMSEVDRLKKQSEELANHNAKLLLDIQRRDVIAETGLPAIFAERLKGATKEEMLADAEEIKKILPKQTNNPKLSPTNPANGSPKETEAQQRERLFGRSNGMFDMETIRQQGGGVIWNQKE